MPKQAFTIECADAKPKVVSDGSIEFNGKTYTPDAGKAFIASVLCQTFPTVNCKGRCVTAATLANSAASAAFQAVDVEHKMAKYGRAPNDHVVGCIVDWSFPDKEAAVAAAAAGEPVAFDVLYAVFRNCQGVPALLDDLADSRSSWSSSFEISRDTTTDGLVSIADGAVTAWADAGEDMRGCVERGSVGNHDGKAMALALGGADGLVDITGAALTRIPADRTAVIRAATASTWALEAASAEEEGARCFPIHWRGFATEEAKAAIVIGQTEHSPDGHVHPINSDLSIGVEAGHSHWATIIAIPDEARIIGKASPCLCMVQGGDGAYQEHEHRFTISFSGDGTATASGGQTRVSPPLQELLSMETTLSQKVAAALKLNAQTCDGDDKAAMLALATEVEHAATSSTVEEAIAAQVAAGDLVPKDQHEAAVAQAGATAVDAYKAEVAEQASVTEQRTQALADAGLAADSQYGTKTIGQETAAIPVGDEGDAQFQAKIAEWQAIKAQITAAVADATAGTPETASADGEPQGTVVPSAGNTVTAGDAPTGLSMGVM